MKKVLVTGADGFIGMFLAIKKYKFRQSEIQL